jgi:hypothetical protein
MAYTDEWGTTRSTTIDLGNTDTIGIGPWQRSQQRQIEAPDSAQPPADDDHTRT